MIKNKPKPLIAIAFSPVSTVICLNYESYYLKKWAFVVTDLLNGSKWDPHYGDQWDAPAHPFSPHWVCVLPIVNRSVLDDAGDQYTLCREKYSHKTMFNNHHYYYFNDHWSLIIKNLWWIYSDSLNLTSTNIGQNSIQQTRKKMFGVFPSILLTIKEILGTPDGKHTVNT